MAPTICMSEHLPTRQEKASPYFSRRRLQFKRDLGHEPNAISGRSKTTMLQNISAWLPKCPPDSSLSVSYFKKQDDRCKDHLAKREGLLNIIIRTISLMRRNHVLQQKVDALRAETQEFINSVISNSENRNIKSSQSPLSIEIDEVSLVSSTTKEDQHLATVECTNNTPYLLVSSNSTTSSNSSTLQDDF